MGMTCRCGKPALYTASGGRRWFCLTCWERARFGLAK